MIKTAALFIGAILLSAAAFAQTPRLAYVDSKKILADLPEAQLVQKELESVAKGWEDEYKRMADEFQKSLEDYQKKEAVLSATAKETQQKQLGDMRQKLQEYQVKKFGQGGEMQEIQEMKFTPIRERILTAIESVAKDEGFNFVFDHGNEALTLLLYADVKYDLTYKVLDELKRGASSSKPSK